MIYRIYRQRLQSVDGVGIDASTAGGLTIFDREVGDAYDPAKEYTPPDGRGPVLSALPRAAATVERNVVPFGLAPVS